MSLLTPGDPAPAPVRHGDLLVYRKGMAGAHLLIAPVSNE